MTVPVPAHTSVDATYTILSSDIQAYWTANLKFSGCVNAWIKQPFEGENLLSFPVHEVYPQYVPGMNCWVEEGDGDICRRSFCNYTTKGEYSGVAGS